MCIRGRFVSIGLEGGIAIFIVVILSVVQYDFHHIDVLPTRVDLKHTFCVQNICNVH